MKVDVLLPESILLAGGTNLSQARSVVHAILIALGLTSLTAIIFFSVGYDQSAVWILSTSMAYLLVFGLLWLSKKPQLSAHGFLLILFAVVSVSSGYEILSVIALPVAGAALAGPRWGLVWLCVGAIWAGLISPFYLNTDVPGPLGISAAMITVVVGVVAIVVEMTRRAALDEAITQRRQRQAAQDRIYQFAEATFPGMAIVAGSEIEYASAGVLELVGYQPAEFRKFSIEGFVHPDDLPVIRNLIDKGDRGFREEARLRHKNGEWVWLEVYALAISDDSDKSQWLFAARDVRQERRNRERMNQAQRLEGLGVMAAGIAHDFNNLLSIIIGRAELLPPGQDRDQIIDAGTQAAKLTASLQAFGKQGSRVAQVIDLNVVLERLKPMFKSLLSKHSLEISVAPDCRVKLAEGQLDQVLLNLVSNANEAMDHDAGRVRISAQTIILGNDGAKEFDLAEGKFVRLQVSDSGIGMTNEVLQRAFEPFYSTKPMYEGSGLGLASVYGIVKEGGGSADIESSPGQGTTVSILLPLAEGEPEIARQEVKSEKTFVGLTCVVAEDDQTVQELMQNFLEALGFSVELAQSPAEVLEICARELPDVVVSDVVMPGMRGTDLAGRLGELYPTLPVLLVSGYGSDQLMSLSDSLMIKQENEHRRFLAKPFRLPELVGKLSELLEQNS
ncbi:MAG: ATP-binding protein [Pseudomonadota bacterium]